MKLSIDPKSLTTWLPLMIVAGYFLFLIATWMKYSSVMKDVIAKLEPKNVDPIDPNHSV